MTRPMNVIELRQSQKDNIEAAYNRGFKDGIKSIRKDESLNDMLVRLDRGER